MLAQLQKQQDQQQAQLTSLSETLAEVENRCLTSQKLHHSRTCQANDLRADARSEGQGKGQEAHGGTPDTGSMDTNFPLVLGVVPPTIISSLIWRRRSVQCVL